MHPNAPISSPEYLWRQSRPRPYRILLHPYGPAMCERGMLDTPKAIDHESPSTCVMIPQVARLATGTPKARDQRSIRRFGHLKIIPLAMSKSEFLVETES